nr:M14 family zinc carboxypeptidase [Micromonospora sp. DSM 115978]
MQPRRRVAVLTVGLLLAGAPLTAGPPAAAAPVQRPTPGQQAAAQPAAGVGASREPGNGPDRNEVAAVDQGRSRAPAGAANRPGTPGDPPLAGVAPKPGRPGVQQGYPRQTQLRVYPTDPADRAIKLGLVPYHDIAPTLNDLQARSDRVSVEVVGESTLGRDLYLVTITAPETPAQTRRQDRWRAQIEDDPRRAARDRELRTDYKAPIWINANIHGDEWEGTDGALRLAEELATATDAATAKLLGRTRIYLTVTNNPDGRVAGTRANGAGFDMNRDHATGSQPETRAVRDVLIATQPLIMLDEHGYTGTTLIEPATAPHGRNYDYDLYIKHAYPNALGMEAAVTGLGHPETAAVDIPFRDYAPGDWDDWPPIFTPMYAMYHGAVGHTVEVPLQVNRNAYNTLPVEELRRRAAINTDVAEATMRAAIGYLDTHRSDLIADQIELFCPFGGPDQGRVLGHPS